MKGSVILLSRVAAWHRATFQGTGSLELGGVAFFSAAAAA